MWGLPIIQTAGCYSTTEVIINQQNHIALFFFFTWNKWITELMPEEEKSILKLHLVNVC